MRTNTAAERRRQILRDADMDPEFVQKTLELARELATLTGKSDWVEVADSLAEELPRVKTAALLWVRVHQVVLPDGGKRPSNICRTCADEWIAKIRTQRAAGEIETRAIECRHDLKTGQRTRDLRMAYLTMNNPQWQEIHDIQNGARWNELHHWIAEDDGARAMKMLHQSDVRSRDDVVIVQDDARGFVYIQHQAR